MSVESYSEAEAGHLFEELFLHYKKRRILEKEMMDFFKLRGLEIKDRKQLEFLIYKAEKALGWMTAGVGPDWVSAVFANSPEDLEKFLDGKKKKKKT
jgi:hypothetical protein